MHNGSPVGNHQYLLHWKEHLPREQHYTISSGILNISLIYLIEDLKEGVLLYLKELEINHQLQEYFTLRNITL
jgi:hypothetical protein